MTALRDSASSAPGGSGTVVDGLSNLSLMPASPSTPAAQRPSVSPPASSSSIFNNPGIPLSPSPAAPSSSQPSVSGSIPQKVGRRPGGFSVFSAGGRPRRKSNESAVKEVDDPTNTPSGSSTALFEKSQSTPNTLTRLFANSTPQHLYGAGSRGSSYRGSDSVKLEDFLYTRGFLEGTCSDITIVAFGTRYRLHRLILDRSPYFSSCFNGGWAESTSSEIPLSPEVSDPNIEQHAFELALARLYGHVDREQEDIHALPLFAAASYLELQDLAESCVASLLRNLKTSNIASIIKFVTNSYYGPPTDRLLESAKALLYRDGWEMDFREWDGISGEVAAEIAGYEGFYVPTEYARYCFVRDLIDWRLRKADTASRYEDENFGRSDHEPLKLGDGTENYSTSCDSEDDEDVKPLRELLQTGIFYVHMSFEELQRIASDTDTLGRATVGDHIIKDALWQQMLLRQKVLNAPNDNAELGITRTEYISHRSSRTLEVSSALKVAGKLSRSQSPASARGSRPVALEPRKYYIPTEDSTTVIGDCPEQPPQVIVSSRGLPRSLPPANEPNLLTDASKGTKDCDGPPTGEEVRYSQFPPFRFSAEFKSVRTLKERKRVYSKTVFYAGSYWNIYIQKVKSSKNVQLGVYLHRAKDREGSSSSSRDGESTQIATLEERSSADRASHDEQSLADMTMTTMDGDITSATAFSSVSRANTSMNRSSHISTSPPTEVSSPTLGHYVDSRPMIQTYFKIFSPSRKGKMLSMFSSGPDSFNFSQSWGWKSSSLILEEGLTSSDNDKDSRLRFMVVLGNV